MGAIPRIATNLLLLKGASLVGVNFGGHAMRFSESTVTICEEVMSLMAKDDALWPLISRRELMSDGGGAIAGLLDRSGVGKILLHTGD